MSFVSWTLAGSSIGIFAETAMCLESNSLVLEWESGSSELTITRPPLTPPSAPQWIVSPWNSRPFCLTMQIALPFAKDAPMHDCSAVVSFVDHSARKPWSSAMCPSIPSTWDDGEPG